MTLPSSPRFLLLRPDAADEVVVVHGSGGESLGHLVGVVLGIPDGLPAFAIVGGTGLLAHHRPVPWSLMRWDGDGVPSLPVPEEAWSRVPTVPPEAPVDWNDEAVHHRILSFYDRRTETIAVVDDVAGRAGEQVDGNPR